MSVNGQLPQPIGQIQIAVFDNGDVQARTNLPSFDALAALGVATAKLAKLFEQKAKEDKPGIILAREVPKFGES